MGDRASSENAEHMRPDLDAAPEDVEAAQQALLRRALADAPPPHDSTNSLAPFAPTEPRRAVVALNAARVREDDVLYDLGCGDGSVLVEAAKTIGCRCVGVELDAALVAECRENAAANGVADKCSFVARDLTTLTPSELARGRLGPTCDVPAPTVAFAWLTGGGLTKFSRTLRRAWDIGRFRIVTCVDALDTCVDYETDGAFAEHEDQGWVGKVYRDGDADAFGVFVVPPAGTSLERWRRESSTMNV